MITDHLYPEPTPPDLCICIGRLSSVMTGSMTSTNRDCPQHGEDILLTDFADHYEYFEYDGRWTSTWVGVYGQQRHLHRTSRGNFTHVHQREDQLRGHHSGDRHHEHPYQYFRGRTPDGV